MKVSVARALSLGILAGMLALPMGPVAAAGEDDEMVIETPKVYKEDTVNGVHGYWVEFQRKKYKKIQSTQGSKTQDGIWAGSQELAYSKAFGGNYTLSSADHTLLNESSYFKSARAGSADSNDWWNKHDLNMTSFQNAVSRMASLAQGDINAVLEADVKDGYTLQSLGDRAFGTSYVYTASDKRHTIGYVHGVLGLDLNALPQDQKDAYNRIKNKSYQDAFKNNLSDVMKLAKTSQFQPLLEAVRIQWLIELMDTGLPLPQEFKLDLKLAVPQGELVIAETKDSLGATHSAQKTALRNIRNQLFNLITTTHSPVVLDLNHDGKIGVTGTSTAQKRSGDNQFVAKNAVWFDLTAEGKKRHVEWLNGDGDGFLVWDADKRVSKAVAKGGEVDAKVLFGNAIGYSHGYHKLIAYAGTVDVASVLGSSGLQWGEVFKRSKPITGAKLNGLKVWIDGNRDAKVQANELKTLKDLGITEIGTVPTIVRNKDGELLIRSYYVQNGKRHMSEDVWFAENPNQPTR